MTGEYHIPEEMEALCLELSQSQIAPYVFLPLVGSDLYPFAVIKL